MKASEFITRVFRWGITCIEFLTIFTLPDMAQVFCSQGSFNSFKEALAARMIYLAVRNTCYKLMYDKFKPVKLTNDLTYREKGVIASISGGIGTFFSHSYETMSVRKIGDVGRAAQFQRTDLRANLSNGLGINVFRAMVLNGIIIWPYEVMKEKLYITFGDIWPNRFMALTVATLVGMGTTIILDNIKTRFMFAHSDPKLNRLNYSTYYEAFSKAAFHEGLPTFFAGAYPMFLKMFLYSASVC